MHRKCTLSIVFWDEPVVVISMTNALKRKRAFVTTFKSSSEYNRELIKLYMENKVSPIPENVNCKLVPQGPNVVKQ